MALTLTNSYLISHLEITSLPNISLRLLDHDAHYVYKKNTRHNRFLGVIAWKGRCLNIEGENGEF